MPEITHSLTNGLPGGLIPSACLVRKKEKQMGPLLGEASRAANRYDESIRTLSIYSSWTLAIVRRLNSEVRSTSDS